jgi:hypothetical protein
VGEVVRRAAKAAWLATKAFPKAEKRIGIDDVPDESEKVPVKIFKHELIAYMLNEN